jgi:putative tryptophan/tyrosine transport system substrate-binding protein
MSLRLFLLGLVWLLIRPASADGGIYLILSESAAAHQEAAEAFRSAMGANRPVRILAMAEMVPGKLQSLTQGVELIVPVGIKAARFVAENHSGQAAVLTLMVPRSAGERLDWPASLGRRKTSFVYIDQPVPRSLDLVGEVFPKAHRIGVVVSSENAGISRMLSQEAGRRQLSLNLETVASPDEVAAALNRVLQESDVLLLVPDAMVINAANAQNVLLTTYRHRVPVVGFSQGLSKAGAVVSVYSSPSQIGRQGAQMALRWLENGDLPGPQPASEFSLSFNSHVARSLGVALPDENEIRRKLGASE